MLAIERMPPDLPKKPALSDTPEFLERGLLLLAVLLTAFAFLMPYTALLRQIGLQISAELRIALSAL
jgi:hypothetical protein